MFSCSRCAREYDYCRANGLLSLYCTGCVTPNLAWRITLLNLYQIIHLTTHNYTFSHSLLLHNTMLQAVNFPFIKPTLRAQFSDDEIFNADETGLFYKLTPDKTLKLKGEKCTGGKLSKERITVMVAANMSGTAKKKLLVIGKSQRLRCFKNVRHLPVDYESNRKAWMTGDIFTKWARAWDRELTKKNKKILLLVDNCPAHPHIADLKSITLVFLPPNTTSVLQPMDQGIIRALKAHFRKNLVLKMIQFLDGGCSSVECPKITVLDAILMIQDA